MFCNRFIWSVQGPGSPQGCIVDICRPIIARPAGLDSGRALTMFLLTIDLLIYGIAEFSGLEFAGLENDGQENDRVEQEET